MIIDTIRLSANSNTSIRLNGNTMPSLDGRRVRRSAIGGRFFIADDNTVNVRLEQNASFRDQELTLSPPVSVTVNGARTYEGVLKLKFVGETMLIESNEDQRRKEAVSQQENEIRALENQEQRLRQELKTRQDTIRRLEQDNQAEEERIAQLTGIAESLKQQKNQLESVNGSLKKQQEDLAQMNANLTQAQKRAAALNREYSDKTAEQEKAAQENEVLASAIRFLQERLADDKGRYDALKQQEDKLNADLDNYSPEVIENLRNTIQSLQQQHDAARSEWTRLSGELRVWETRIESQRNANEGLSQEIARQPEELQQLQQSYEALSHRLSETVNAQEMCSEEKQRELQAQIDEQEPVARKLTEQFEALKTQASEVNRIISELQEAKDAQLLQLWPQLTNAMAEIKHDINDMNAELESLQTEAAQFDQHVLNCAERMEQLREWYHADMTPLQKLLDRLGAMSPSENEQLLQTMNPANVGRVRQLFESVEAGLTDLDAILKDVISSAQNDEKFASLKTTTNEQHARQEMKR